VTRGVSPVVAAPLLVGVTVVLAAVVGVMAMEFGPPGHEEPRVLSAHATDDGRIELTHESGPAINLTAVSIVVTVDGEPLDHQPPVPFFSASGFYPGPTGPFNVATDALWESGERATVRVAGTNAPSLRAGATVTIRVLHEETRIALVETTVQAA